LDAFHILVVGVTATGN